MRVAATPEWCVRAPVPRSPAGARAPPTIDHRATGPPAHTTGARCAVRFGARRDAAYRGPLEASVTDIRTDFGADEGSAREIPFGSHEPSNHDLSASSRNASRRVSSVRASPSIDRLPTHAGGDRSFSGKAVRRALRTSVGDAVRSGEFGGGKENGGRPPPFPVAAPRPIVGLPRCGAGRDDCRSAGGCGNRESAASRTFGAARRQPRGPDRYTPRVFWPRRGGSKQGIPREVLRSRDQGASSVP
jgi:hypothetical protein